MLLGKGNIFMILIKETEHILHEQLRSRNMNSNTEFMIDGEILYIGSNIYAESII
jgi:hypothetical protein